MNKQISLQLQTLDTACVWFIFFPILCDFFHWLACCDSCSIGKLFNRQETKSFKLRISQISWFFWRLRSSALSPKPVFEKPRLYMKSVIRWVGASLSNGCTLPLILSCHIPFLNVEWAGNPQKYCFFFIFYFVCFFLCRQYKVPQ